jgi:predicted AlkP superfamily pyrophosphatase or phosphodiesterase
LIGNKFPSKDRTRFYSLADREAVQDGSWYGGQPIWVAAEKNGLVSAAYYFVGTEAAIDGVPMTYWHTFDASVPGQARVDQAIEWLSMPEDQRPHLITLYFEDVDAATHRYGPGSSQSIESIQRVDAYVGTLLAGIDELPVADDVYVVIVSDHGQSATLRNEPPFIIESVVSLDGVSAVDHGAAAFLYLPEPDRQFAIGIRDAINESWQHGSAMLRENAPKDWHVTAAAGFADIIVQADPGFTVFTSGTAAKSRSAGDHGWAPEFQDMHGIFLAMGPRLPKGVRISAIEAVDVYPMLMDILDLPITAPIDGDPLLLPELLLVQKGVGSKFPAN